MRLAPLRELFFLLWRLDLSEGEKERVRRISVRLKRQDWEGLLRLALRTGMAPVVYRGLREAGALDVVPAVERRGLKRLVLRGAARVAALLRLFEILRGALSTLKIPGIVLKGFALGLRFYPHPSLRCADDLDLLIPRGKMGVLADFLSRGGVHLHFHRWPKWSRGRSLHVVVGGVEADVDEGFKWFDPLADYFWGNSEPLDGWEPLRLPGPEGLLLHTCLHAVMSDHPIPAILPRTVCDISAITSRARVDWDEVVRVAEWLGAAKEVALALDIAARRLDDPSLRDAALELLPLPPRTFRKLADRLLAEALSPSPTSSRGVVAPIRAVLSFKTPFDAIVKAVCAFTEPLDRGDVSPLGAPNGPVRRQIWRFIARPLIVPARLAAFAHTLGRAWLIARALGPPRPL